MHALSCPHHGEEALEYLRGCLDNAAALQAEKNLETCPHCSAWYETAFSGSGFDAVDQAVQISLRETVLPRRTRHHRWLAAAAAVILVVAGGYGWMQRVDTGTPTVVDQPPTIASFDFDDGVIGYDNAVVFVDDQPEVVVEHATVQDDSPLSSNDLESGDFGSWEIHT